jgi:tetratricopeptide (TPR) repeat protein
MKTGLHVLILFLAVTALVLAVGCRRQGAVGTVGLPADAPLASYRYELLDLAFGAASAMPVEPHIKDRSLTQETVATACLDLGQPQRALRYIDQIGNWRRGAGYADLAFYAAQHGAKDEDVEPYLARAAQVAAETEDWRRDRVNVKIARTRASLGQTQQADRLTTSVEPSETDKVAGVKAMVSDDNAFDEQMKNLDVLIAQGQFDVLRNALDACTELFDRFYTNENRRSQVEQKIKTSWDKLPVFVRMELLMEMSRSALDHADQSKALDLVNETQHLMDASQWPLEQRIPRAAQMIALRFRAGDKEKARADADALRSVFDAEGGTIVNVYRAGALRPLAETYQAMGDTAAALEVYRKVIEAGIENPNSRPRAEDLAATCCSMAVHGVEPGPELWSRIRDIRKGLGDPW